MFANLLMKTAILVLLLDLGRSYAVTHCTVINLHSSCPKLLHILRLLKVAFLF